MIYSKAFPYESMLSAKVEYECRTRGAERMAYDLFWSCLKNLFSDSYHPKVSSGNNEISFVSVYPFWSGGVNEWCYTHII